MGSLATFIYRGDDDRADFTALPPESALAARSSLGAAVEEARRLSVTEAQWLTLAAKPSRWLCDMLHPGGTAAVAARLCFGKSLCGERCENGWPLTGLPAAAMNGLVRQLYGGTSDMDLAALNIVEIGRPVVKLVLPQTRCFASAISGAGEVPPLERLRDLPDALSDPKLDLVICHAQSHSPWTPRWWLKKLFNRQSYRHGVAITSMFRPAIPAAEKRQATGHHDWSDNRTVEPADAFMLKRQRFTSSANCQPTAGWPSRQSQAKAIPSERFRKKRANLALMGKLMPLSLGPPVGKTGGFPPAPRPKTADIFFAGQSEGASTIRSGGMAELRVLAAEGYRIDIPQTRLDRQAFSRAGRRPRLVWSPEGYGWDCFRHYETPLCWSVSADQQPDHHPPQAARGGSPRHLLRR